MGGMERPDTSLDADLTKFLRDLGLEGTVHRAFWASGMGRGELRLFGYTWTHSPTEEDHVLARSEAADTLTAELDRELRAAAEVEIKKAAEPPAKTHGPLLERLR